MKAIGWAIGMERLVILLEKINRVSKNQEEKFYLVRWNYCLLVLVVENLVLLLLAR